VSTVSQSSEIRKFNYIDDAHILTDDVVDRRQEDGRCVVDMEMCGTNQRDTVTCPAKATVALPSREQGPVRLLEPPADMAAKAVQMLERHYEIVAERKAAGEE
jgi:hypothetical protein